MKSLCVDIFLLGKYLEWNCWIICHSTFNYFKKLPNYFPKCLHQFVLLPEMHDGSSFSTLLLSNFFITAILMGVKWYLTEVFICISLLTNSGQYHLIYLLATHVSSLMKNLFKYFAHFLIGLFSYYWVVRVLCIFWIQVLHQICDLEKISPSLWLIFSFS